MYGFAIGGGILAGTDPGWFTPLIARNHLEPIMAEKKTPEILTVKMDDGRIVDFTGKTRLLKDASYDATHVFVRMDFRNGETRTFKTPHGQADAAVGAFAITCMGHGLEQKLGDVTSGIDAIEDAIEAVDTLMARLERGEWNVVGGGGTGMAGASVLARALVEVSGQPIAVVRDMLAGMDNKTKAALRLDPEVAPVIKRMEAERDARAAERGKTATKVDTSSVLAGLRAGQTPGQALAAATGA